MRSVLSVLALLVAAAATGGAPPKVPGPRIVQVGDVFEVEFEEDAAGPAVLSNPYPLDELFVREAKASRPKTVAYIVQPKKPGTYRLTLWTKGDTVGDKLPVVYYEFVVGGTVPPPPAPGPGPVDPPPAPGPADQVKTFRVIFVYESETTLTPEQRAVVYGRVVEDWVTANCTGGKAGWRRRDKDAPGEADAPMAALWAVVKPKISKVPCVAVAVTRGTDPTVLVDIIDLEPTPAKMVEVLAKYRGK